MSGPKPKPMELRALEGNPSKRPLKETIKPAIGYLPCPAFLLPSARREWKRIVPELEVLGLLTKIDRAALAQYCQAWGRWSDAEKTVKEKGVLYKTQNGNVIQSPMLAVANRAYDQLRLMLAEFGMTPSARARLGTASTQDDGDPMEAILSGNRVN